MIDYSKRAIVPMVRNKTQKVEFEIVIYGYTSRELMSVPNNVIGILAQRYPDHTSSPFLLRPGTDLFHKDMLGQKEIAADPLVGFGSIR